MEEKDKCLPRNTWVTDMTPKLGFFSEDLSVKDLCVEISEDKLFSN